MLEEIRTLIYDDEEGLMLRIRDGCDELSPSEEEKLLKFAGEINAAVRRGEDHTDGLLILFDLVYCMAMHEGLRGNAAELHAALLNGLDF